MNARTFATLLLALLPILGVCLSCAVRPAAAADAKERKGWVYENLTAGRPGPRNGAPAGGPLTFLDSQRDLGLSISDSTPYSEWMESPAGKAFQGFVDSDEMKDAAKTVMIRDGKFDGYRIEKDGEVYYYRPPGEMGSVQRAAGPSGPAKPPTAFVYDPAKKTWVKKDPEGLNPQQKKEFDAMAARAGGAKRSSITDPSKAFDGSSGGSDVVRVGQRPAPKPDAEGSRPAKPDPKSKKPSPGTAGKKTWKTPLPPSIRRPLSKPPLPKNAAGAAGAGKQSPKSAPSATTQRPHPIMTFFRNSFSRFFSFFRRSSWRSQGFGSPRWRGFSGRSSGNASAGGARQAAPTRSSGAGPVAPMPDGQR